MPRTVGLVVSLLLLVLSCPSAAPAATRYAAPNGAPLASSCTALYPCALDHAVNRAAPGDEVVVGAGTYRLGVQLKPMDVLDLHGDRNQARPRIIGDSDLAGALLVFRGGTLAHLSLEATAPKQRALSLQAGTADRVRLLSAAGPSAEIVATKSGSVLRNSIVQGATGGLTIRSKGSAVARNVTVMASAASATGVDCDVDGAVWLVNVLVRGGGTDVRGHKGTCQAMNSNFRPDHTSGLAGGAGNQSGEPLFADGDYRPAAGSPTIDAGAPDPDSGSVDLDGRPRTLGAAPDIGAYEFVPAATGGDDGAADEPGALPEDLRGVPLPKQGVSVVVAPARGKIRVRRPGHKRFRALVEPGRVPVGSVVDARAGRVRLVTAIGARGAVQTGLFWGSTFKTGQRRTGNGMTTLALRGGNLAACRRSPARGGTIALASKKRKKPKRSLWARDRHGRFRTHGNDSVATARGTAWLTQDRCDGTLTRVSDGAVSVRDLRRKRSVLVEAGHSYLARRRG